MQHFENCFTLKYLKRTGGINVFNDICSEITKNASKQ